MNFQPPSLRLGANTVVSATCIIALLHFGREVLEPLALALILSLVLAPLVRSVTRIGLARMPAVLLSVALVSTFLTGVGAVLATQLVTITRDLPQYRSAIRTKVAKVREVVERPISRIEAELSAVAPSGTVEPVRPRRGGVNLAVTAANTATSAPVPVEVRTPRTMKDTLGRIVGLVWGPIGEAGVVLILLVFILLEQGSLRDRLVRLAGQAEVSRTIRTLGDAAQGVSRFFFSQFIVNATFGAAIGLSLWLVGVPHAVLWGVLSGVLRFVPYLGVLLAGAIIAVFVAAIDPGWSLAVTCMAMFLAFEVVLANFIEPKVYGHSSGLSPLAVIVSALFWGALWGPVGLLLSTPLTLCLVVAGRHVRALAPITILLGDAPNMSDAERFHQRVLAGEADELTKDAQAYVRRFSFARYCDHVLLPGLRMAVSDLGAGTIDKLQQDRMRAVIANIAETVASASESGSRTRRKAVPLLDANIGAHLRQMREARFGRWQGSLDVPSGSIVLCAGLPSERDEFLTELLVRALREAEVDARSIVAGAPQERPEPAHPGLVSTVFITYPRQDNIEEWLLAVAELRADLPEALMVTVLLPYDEQLPKRALVEEHVDMILRSFEEGLAFVAPDRAAQANGAPARMRAA
ncbi:AI-2E family transporter [Telluria aromaticivorans]|uniref:AI-2E family transporter n=1 Tax=Telluria aromaticivorans TaxID=2725995 RepID=A0A7Y2NZ41_9BURK|nr:AI-2E family transporter [Telluria aromaticivorans]NNG21419.1 AI-2E family transporter [Telluria aromaticivorans]